jgi:hypothetical protein
MLRIVYQAVDARHLDFTPKNHRKIWEVTGRERIWKYLELCNTTW